MKMMLTWASLTNNNMRISIILTILLAATTTVVGQAGSQEKEWAIQKNRVAQKYGVVNLSGDTIIPFIFDKLRVVNDSTLIANSNEKWFLIDSKGSRKSTTEYKYLSPSKDGLLIFYTDSLVGAVNLNEQVIIKPRYEFLHQYDSNIFSATINKKKGLINIHEEIIVPFEYNGILMYLDVVFLRRSEKWAIADKNGELKSDYIYKWVNYRKGDNFILLSKDGERIKVDSKGNSF